MLPALRSFSMGIVLGSLALAGPIIYTSALMLIEDLGSLLRRR
jgi:hypothetical protein